MDPTVANTGDGDCAPVRPDPVSLSAILPDSKIREGWAAISLRHIKNRGPNQQSESKPLGRPYGADTHRTVGI